MGGLPAFGAAEKDAFPDAEIKAVEMILPQQPHGIGRPISDRAFWERLARLAGNAPVKAGEDVLKKPMPAWSDEAYLDFFKTGVRRNGQAMIFPRWESMRILAMAELLENKGRFLPALEEIMTSLVRQPSWVLPAHDKGKEVFEKHQHYVDLAAADAGYDIALVLGRFGDRLSASLREEMSSELSRRVIEPTFAGIEGKDARIASRHFWRNVEMNWNAVCTEGTTGAILAFEPSVRRRALAVLEARRNSRIFLSGFG